MKHAYSIIVFSMKFLDARVITEDDKIIKY